MYYLPFDDDRCNAESIDQVGGKNASLGELMDIDGVRVPPGFALTTSFYEDFLEETGLGDFIVECLSGKELTNQSDATQASQEIQAAFEREPLPSSLEEVVQEAWTEFVDDLETESPAVAVRSSATAEDLPEASFAGAQDTHLNVRGLETVKDRVKQCMQSLYTTRAITYREEQGFSGDDILISVGVQTLIDARSSGVMFTVNPINGDRSKVKIESNWGLGESIVGGDVTPDSFLVDKPVLDIVDTEVSTKEVHTKRTPTGTELAETDPEKRDEPSLSNAEVKELARLAKRIEQNYDQPQDIEWAITEDGTPYILQSRPETTWENKERPTPSNDSKKSPTVDIIEDVI